MYLVQSASLAIDGVVDDLAKQTQEASSRRQGTSKAGNAGENMFKLYVKIGPCSPGSNQSVALSFSGNRKQGGGKACIYGMYDVNM